MFTTLKDSQPDGIVHTYMYMYSYAYMYIFTYLYIYAYAYVYLCICVTNIEVLLKIYKAENAENTKLANSCIITYLCIMYIYLNMYIACTYVDVRVNAHAKNQLHSTIARNASWLLLLPETNL